MQYVLALSSVVIAVNSCGHLLLLLGITNFLSMQHVAIAFGSLLVECGENILLKH